MTNDENEYDIFQSNENEDGDENEQCFPDSDDTIRALMEDNKEMEEVIEKQSKERDDAIKALADVAEAVEELQTIIAEQRAEIKLLRAERDAKANP